MQKMRRGRFGEGPCVPLPVGAQGRGQALADPSLPMPRGPRGQLVEPCPQGGAGVTGRWGGGLGAARGVCAVMHQDSLQIPARCCLRPSVRCLASEGATLPQQVRSRGAAAGGAPAACRVRPAEPPLPKGSAGRAPATLQEPVPRLWGLEDGALSSCLQSPGLESLLEPWQKSFASC